MTEEGWIGLVATIATAGVVALLATLIVIAVKVPL